MPHDDTIAYEEDINESKLRPIINHLIDAMDYDDRELARNALYDMVTALLRIAREEEAQLDD